MLNRYERNSIFLFIKLYFIQNLNYKKIKLFLFFFFFFFIFIQNIIILIEILDNKNRPKISIFLPIFNKEKYIKRSIGSIQRQTLKNIEIIPVNDGSTDNTLEILKELAQKDKRIKIINNDKNHGSLFSRAMGILKSRGEYLMCLDPDDKYKSQNNLKYLYNKAKSYNVDVLFFFILYLPGRWKNGIYTNFNKIMKQPELYKIAFNKNNLLNDFYITNKLIKRELFENAYKLYKKYIYGNKWNYHEDNIWSILIHKIANSLRCLKKIIYIYNEFNDSVMKNKGNILELENLLYRYDMYKEIFNSADEKKYLIAGYFQLLEVFENNINIIYKNKKIKKNFIIKMKEFISNYNISESKLKKINLLLNKLSSNTFIKKL